MNITTRSTNRDLTTALESSNFVGIRTSYTITDYGNNDSSNGKNKTSEPEKRGVEDVPEDI